MKERGKSLMMDFQTLYQMYDYCERMKINYMPETIWDYWEEDDIISYNEWKTFSKKYLIEICKLFEIPLDKSGRA